MQILSTMPLNPRHAGKIGFYSLFSFSHLLGGVSGFPAVFALNQVGSTLDGSIEVLQEGLDLLGISPYDFWRDTDISQRDIQVATDTLFEKKGIVLTRNSITSCACGKAQYLSSASLYKTKSSLVSEEGKALCCQTDLRTQEKIVIVTRPIPPISLLLEVSPVWAYSELKAACNKLEGQTLYISRTDARQFSVRIFSGEMFNVDNDLVWMLFLFLLGRKDFSLHTLISGMSTVRQVAVILAMCSLLEISCLRKVVFLPRVGFKPAARLDTLQKTVDRFGSVVVRNALLWAAMSESKEFTLDGSIFPKVVDTAFEGYGVLPKRRDFLRS